VFSRRCFEKNRPLEKIFAAALDAQFEAMAREAREKNLCFTRLFQQIAVASRTNAGFG
jgi:hypothetical protein